MFSRKKYFDHVAPAANSMPQDALKDLYCFLHFIDDSKNGDPASNADSKDGEQDDDCQFLHLKLEVSKETANHQTKFCVLEYSYNKLWQVIVHFGKWVMMDKLRVAGWYHSIVAIRPKPKLINTGYTIQTICVKRVKILMFKLLVCVCGGQCDTELNDKHCGVQKTVKGLQKWVNLFNITLEPFKGKIHCVVLDSEYIGDNMTHIGSYIQKINMVGKTQANQVGAIMKEVIDTEMTRNMFNCIFWQHNKEPLNVTLWLDNNIVKTLSNYHCVEYLKGDNGVYQKKRVNGSTEQT